MNSLDHYKTIDAADIDFLRSVCAPERVIPGPAVGEDYCHDELSGIRRRPDVLIKAASAKEVSAVMKYAYEHAIPVFADYVRYLPFARHPRNAFFLGMEGGAACYLKARPENTRHPNDKMVPYLNGKLGFDFGVGKRFGINVGLNLIWGLGHGIGLSSEGGHGLAAMVGFRF